MANSDPTGERSTIAPDLPAPQVAWLRQTLTSCLVGVRGDLANPAEMPNPEKARDEANTYKRLLSGLIRGEITVPDEPARLAIEAIAVETDRENGYTRVVAEHDPLRWLLTHLGARR